MVLVHQPASINLKTGDQLCARCKTALHHVNPSIFTVEGKPDAVLASSSGFATSIEVILHPLQFFDVGSEMPPGCARCEAPDTDKLKQK